MVGAGPHHGLRRGLSGFIGSVLRPSLQLLRIGLIHYQFEAIHPFLDGNGRIGRLLISTLMVEWGLLPGPLLDLSAYIEPRRDRYYRALQGVSRDGDWHTWLLFFLEAVAAQCAVTVVSRAERLRLLREDYRSRVTSPRRSSLVPVLIDGLFASPALTSPRRRSCWGSRTEPRVRTSTDSSRRASSRKLRPLDAHGCFWPGHPGCAQRRQRCDLI
jgi:Fic family protein